MRRSRHKDEEGGDRAGVSPGVQEKGEQAVVDVRLLVRPPDGVITEPGVESLARRLAPAFYLDVGNVCNQRCMYCAVPRQRLYRTSFEQAQAVVAGAAAHGFRRCALIGGEPTIWPSLQRMMERMEALGISGVVLTTNGLMLAYPQFLDDLLRLPVEMVVLSFDDFDQDVQGRLSRRPDAPGLLAAAVENLRTAPVTTCFHAAVTAEMKGRGREYGLKALELARRFARPPAFVFAGLKPVEEARRNIRDLGISLSDAACGIAEALDVLHPHFVAAFRDLPLCLLPERVSHSLDLYHGNAALDLATGRIEESCLEADRDFPQGCDGCRQRSSCPGVHREYLELFGDGELKRVGE